MSLNHLYHSLPSEFVILKKPKIVQNRPGGAGFYIESSRIFPDRDAAPHARRPSIGPNRRPVQVPHPAAQRITQNYPPIPPTTPAIYPHDEVGAARGSSYLDARGPAHTSTRVEGSLAGSSKTRWQQAMGSVEIGERGLRGRPRLFVVMRRRVARRQGAHHLVGPSNAPT